ncbi:hypothetical protein [Halalkalibacter sp. APA_J-10(15)]|uniref:hypothetical protein n=1 Tax=Halalkalibacter sp. APA_J-10(15) TaxID=2933805 RepID=UPI001FF33450|nr:hypothetical protein [Halalkalibacter sp. APA_J-10(15)]MCK0472526.1 hypothetical protein [Halalkalibacter sp. APA_J-10(15)]
MKSFYRLFFVGQGLFIILLAFTALSFVQAEENTAEQSDCHHECAMKFHKEFHVHLDYYYDLLAEKFAPEHLDQWKEIKKERDLLKKKWKEAKKRGDVEKGDLFNQKWLEEHEKIQEQFSNAVEKRDIEAIQDVLPKLFSHYQKMNETWKKALEASS